MVKYLDLRNNLLSEIPTRGLAKHEHLEYLLISNNRINSLPGELGEVRTLKALSWHSNPLEYPEKEVLEQTTPDLKKVLRRRFRERNKQD